MSPWEAREVIRVGSTSFRLRMFLSPSDLLLKGWMMEREAGGKGGERGRPLARSGIIIHV